MFHRFLGITILLLTGWSLPAQQSPHPDLVMDGQVVGKVEKPKPGEYCSLCYEPLHADDLVYVVWGQRVGVHSGSEDEDFRADPKKWTAHMRPSGAFLGTEPEPQRALSDVWFAVGVYVLLGLLFGAICAHQAFSSGYSPGAWFALGMAFNLPAYIVLRLKPKRELTALGGVPKGLHKIASTYNPSACPACGFTNHPSAEKCLGCGATLDPHTASEVARVR